MKNAAIDVGSNSVRLLVDEGLPVQTKTIITTRLGENLALTGRLSSEAITRTAEAVDTLLREAKRRGATRIMIFATEAVRGAKNGADFVKTVKARTGVDVDVIDGALEAQIGFMGACPSRGEPSAVIDIGGASTELVGGACGKITYRKSLPVGAGRLRDMCGEDLAKAAEISRQFAGEFRSLPPFTRLYGIGGTATSLAFMHLKIPAYDPVKVHGTALSLRDVEALASYISGGGNLDMLPKKRAEIIGCGAAELREIMVRLCATEITISETDNLEGYLMYKNI